MILSFHNYKSSKALFSCQHFYIERCLSLNFQYLIFNNPQFIINNILFRINSYGDLVFKSNLNFKTFQNVKSIKHFNEIINHDS